jgi:outer membrane protein OmpA-like peptidoglycan-associated protein
MFPTHVRAAALCAALLFPALLTSGCASLTQTQKGAAIGATAGAVVGGAVGRATGDATRGAIIGAAVGATAGAIIGREMDNQAETFRNEMDGAKVERRDDMLNLTFDSGIFFDFDSSVLRAAARQNLDVLVNTLQQYPGYDVVITGHTDNRGRADYNQSLSERRAQAAGNYLISRGIAAHRVRTTGMGMNAPVASNATDDGRQQNRRVEVAIQASEEYRRELERRSGGGQ